MNWFEDSSWAPPRPNVHFAFLGARPPSCRKIEFQFFQPSCGQGSELGAMADPQSIGLGAEQAKELEELRSEIAEVRSCRPS